MILEIPTDYFLPNMLCFRGPVGGSGWVQKLCTELMLVSKQNCKPAARWLSGSQIYRDKSAMQRKLRTGPGLESFVQNALKPPVGAVDNCSAQHLVDEKHYLPIPTATAGRNRVHLEVYGCQMNANDADIVWSLLRDAGYQKTPDSAEADVVLLVTCAIRERAEEKIWARLRQLKKMKEQRRSCGRSMRIGLLGCMAERLKERILEREQIVDVICGPDAYRDLPRLLTEVDAGSRHAVNVLLSQDETYADVMPVRVSDSGSPTAFVSIMRGCNNMCTYCIVPFTRGRERSRPIQSILDEVRTLSERGIREVTLLGQNVNSYRDTSEGVMHAVSDNHKQALSAGFNTVYKLPVGGLRFADLLDRVSAVAPETRIRFTSPHPKDFPDDVLRLIAERANICRQVHLPAQSGSNAVLAAMQRGYTREAYLQLVEHIRTLVPRCALTSDFISGFCGETDAAHADTLDLLRRVRYHFVYCFPYSQREKTRAHRRLLDDVLDHVKRRRHSEVAAEFRRIAAELNAARVGCSELVLVEGSSRRSEDFVVGRNEQGTKVIVPKALSDAVHGGAHLRPGDLVRVQVVAASSQVLHGRFLHFDSLANYRRFTSTCADVGCSAACGSEPSQTQTLPT